MGQPVKQSLTGYPMYCPWCLEENIENIMNYTAIPGSSMICARHTEEMIRKVMEAKDE